MDLVSFDRGLVLLYDFPYEFPFPLFQHSDVVCQPRRLARSRRAVPPLLPPLVLTHGGGMGFGGNLRHCLSKTVTYYLLMDFV